MTRLLLPFFFTALLTGWLALAQELSESGAVSGIRQPRGLKQKKLCRKYGICGQGYGGYGGHQGGYGGQQGGYGGYQGGYGGIPPINIGISQSQSSANAGGGGYGTGYYPNNYQYNNGLGGGHGGYQGGYGGHQGGYGGHQRPFGGQFGNGQGAYNNQFNGNYYGPAGGFGNGAGYGFQGPFGNGYYDEGENSGVKPIYEDNAFNRPESDQGSYNQGSSNYETDDYTVAGAFAYSGASAGRKNS